MTRHIWTVASCALLLLFLFAAAVQLNDPDPLGWIALYAAAAAVCALEIRRRTPAWAPLVVAAVAVVWAASLWPRARDVPLGALFAEWEMRNLRVEEAREMYGLAIVALWMTITAAIVFRRRRRSSDARE